MATKRKADNIAISDLNGGIKKAKVASHLQPPPSPSAQSVMILALEHDTAQGKYAYFGSGLLKHLIPFSSNISPSLPSLAPVLTKSGSVAKRQPAPSQQSLDWWKAQCAFRGLPQTGEIRDLQERLRPERDAGMVEELRALEARLDVDFWTKNAAAHETLWKGLHSDQQKAEQDMKCFLRERYLGKAPASEAAVFYENMSSAAKSFGLVCERITLPGTGNHSWDQHKYIVVGPTRPAVWTIINELRGAGERAFASRLVQAAKEEDIKQQHAQLVTEGSMHSNAEWDVSGTWVIDCPYVQDGWGQWKDDCQLVIAFEPVRKGQRMWANFDFVVLKGTFRFGKLGEKLVVDQSKVDDWKEGLDSDEEEEEPQPVPKKMKIISKVPNVHPSPGGHKWDFQWRGCETGESEMQIDFDCQHGEPNGTTLQGVFEAGLTEGGIDFTGRKISTSTSSKCVFTAVDLMKEEYTCCDEAAYESARVSRWH